MRGPAAGPAGWPLRNRPQAIYPASEMCWAASSASSPSSTIDCDLSLPGAFEIGRGKVPEKLSDSMERFRNLARGEKSSGRNARSRETRGRPRAGGRRTRRHHHRKLARSHGSNGSTALSFCCRSCRSSRRRLAMLCRENPLRHQRARLSNSHLLPVAPSPKLTLAVLTEPMDEKRLEAIGLAGGNPFYTVDLPYLWGRRCRDGSVVFGAGLVDADDSRDLRQIDITPRRREKSVRVHRAPDSQSAPRAARDQNHAPLGRPDSFPRERAPGLHAASAK